MIAGKGQDIGQATLNWLKRLHCATLWSDNTEETNA
jgi:hypothetical protein